MNRSEPRALHQETSINAEGAPRAEQHGKTLKGVSVPVSIKTASPALAIVAAAAVAPTPTPRRSNMRPRAPVDLTRPGRLRLEDVLAVLRVGRTWFWKGIKSGMYPEPDYYVGKVPFWKHSTILKVIEHGEGGCGGAK